MNNSNNKNESINLLDLFFYLLSKWKWFFLFAILGVLAAYAWYSSTEFTYFRTATISIKDPESKTYSASLNRYDNLINKVNVTNEIYRFRSHKLMKDVVTRTHADVNYKLANRLRYLELYTQAPVTVTFPKEFAERSMSFELTVKKDSSVAIVLGEDKSLNAHFGDTLNVRGIDIVVINLLLSVYSSDYCNSIKTRLLSKISRLSYSFDNSNPVAVDCVCTLSIYRSEHSVLEVQELDRYERVLDVSSLRNHPADKLRYLLDALSCDIDLTEDREDYVAVRVYSIALLGSLDSCSCNTAVCRKLIRSYLRVERYCKLWSPAAYLDVQPVVDMDDGDSLLIDRILLSCLHILQVDELLRRGA